MELSELYRRIKKLEFFFLTQDMLKSTICHKKKKYSGQGEIQENLNTKTKKKWILTPNQKDNSKH